MKKLIILFCFVFIVVTIVTVKYMDYKQDYNELKKYNLEFDKNYQKKIYGIDLTTIINKVINNNKMNNVELDQNGRYINNDINSISMEIKMIDTDKVYPIEVLYNGGIERFVQYYGNIQFECTKIDYHKQTGKVKYLYFEQIDG